MELGPPSDYKWSQIITLVRAALDECCLQLCANPSPFFAYCTIDIVASAVAQLEQVSDQDVRGRPTQNLVKFSV